MAEFFTIETKNLRFADGEMFFADGTSEIIEYDAEQPELKFEAYKGENIIGIILPESVKTIKFGAFNGCRNLKSLTISKNVEEIEDSAFFTCKKLAEITVSEKNKHYKTIDGALFTYDGSELLLYPAGKTEEEYTVPYGVTAICGSAFDGHAELTTVNIPESVTSIGSGAFSDCRNLKNITIPKGLVSLGGGAFENCASLVNIALPWGVSAIYDSTFRECTSLRSITITRNVTVIKDRAFFGCSRLESINIEKDDGALEITPHKDEMKENDDKFSKYKEGFLGSKTSIGWYAFSGCHSLTTVTIPDGAYSIGRNAFSGCNNLKNVIIPKSVNYIGEDIFENCKNLENIYYKGSMLRWAFVKKPRISPEEIKVGEYEYRSKSANVYCQYSDSKFYKFISWFCKDRLHQPIFSLIQNILIAVLIVNSIYLVGSILMYILFGA